jgi:hypothetical protein
MPVAAPAVQVGPNKGAAKNALARAVFFKPIQLEAIN